MQSKTVIALLDDFFIEHIRMTKQHNMPVQHYHDLYEIYLQIEGERGLFLDKAEGGSAEYFHLKKGDLVITEPFVIHYTRSFENISYERYVMNFNADSMSVILDKKEIAGLLGNMHTCVIHLNENELQKAYGYFKKIDEYSKSDSEFSAKLMYSELFQFIHYIGGIGENIKSPKENFVPDEVLKAMSFVKKHYSESITLDFMLRYLHTSKSRFCYKFREFTGTSFMEYVYNVRTSQVHRLLAETKKPLYEIAEETGFSSTAHMTKIFKKAYGASPREFRK